MKRMRSLGLAGLVLAGCAHPSPSASTSAIATGVVTDTIWYVSARARDSGRVTTRLADSLEYGFVVADHRGCRTCSTQDLGLVVARFDSSQSVRIHRLVAGARDGERADRSRP